MIKLRINENNIEVPEKFKQLEDVYEIYWLKDAFEEFGFSGEFIKSNQSFTYWHINKNNIERDIKIPAHFTSKSKARNYIKLLNDNLF